MEMRNGGSRSFWFQRFIGLLGVFSLSGFYQVGSSSGVIESVPNCFLEPHFCWNITAVGISTSGGDTNMVNC